MHLFFSFSITHGLFSLRVPPPTHSHYVLLPLNQPIHPLIHPSSPSVASHRSALVRLSQVLDQTDTLHAVAIAALLEPQQQPMASAPTFDAESLAFYYSYCKAGLAHPGSPSLRAAAVAMLAALFPQSFAAAAASSSSSSSSSSSQSPPPPPAEVLEVLPQLAELAAADPWWDVKAQVLKVAATLLPPGGSSGDNEVAAAAAALIGNILGAMATSGEVVPEQPAPPPLHPGLRVAAVQALAPLLAAYPTFVAPCLAALYGVPANDRAVLLGLAPAGSGGRKDLASIFAVSLGGGAGGGCDPLVLAAALAADFRAKGYQNLELEHMMVLAAAVRTAVASSASSSSAAAAAAASSSAASLPLGDAWLEVYDGLKDWLLVALADPDCAGLAASVVEAFATASLRREGCAVVKSDLPSALTLCFGGAGDPLCQQSVLALLRRLSAEGPEFAEAVKETVAAVAPELPPDSALLA